MNLSANFKTKRSTLCLVLAMFALSGCTEQVSTIDVDVDGSSELKMVPPSILNTRAIVAENLNLVVTINREPVEMVKSGDQWSGETTLPVGSDVALEVLWSEAVGPRNLQLAVARASFNNVTNNLLFPVEDSDYSLDEFDDDSDSINNITERRQDTDPFDASDPGSVDAIVPDVVISGSQKFNEIDGQFNTIFWNNAQFENAADGTVLRINNLIVDETGTAVPDGPNYQWAGVHDGEFLSLFIFGKSINPASGVDATRDSGAQFFNDDSLEIFFDGNLSQLSDYDQVDDMHIVIPLVRGSGVANKSGEVDTVIERGTNVDAAVVFDVANVEFANCLCQGERVTWEIRINMAEARIPMDQIFGFDIQINQDDDGGERDTKWAWAAPSKLPGQTKEETDVTWKFPNRMGLMKLVPIN